MELHNKLFNYSSLATIIISGDREIVEANMAAYTLFPSTKNIISKESLQWLLGIIDEVNENNILTGFKTYYVSNNDTIDLFYVISHCRIEDQTFTTITFTNPLHEFELGKLTAKAVPKEKTSFKKLDSIIDIKKAEGLINASEEKYRTLVEQAAEPFIINSQDGTILEVNRAACKLLGYSKEEFILLKVHDIILKEDLDRMPIKETELRTGNPVKTKRTLVHKDGHTVTVLVTSKMLSDGRILVIARDMTEWEKTEALLRDTALKLNYAQQVAQIGSWTFDLANKKLEWSDEVFRIFDVDRKTFVPTYEEFLKFIHPDERAALDEGYNTSLKQKTPFKIRHRIVTKTNKVKHVSEKCVTTFDENGRPLITSGTVQDITERKIIDDRLAFNEKQLDLIYNATSAIIYLIEVIGDRFKFISANKAGLEVTGLKPDLFFGKFIEEVIPKKSLPFILGKYKEAIKGRKTISWEEETNYPAGKKVWAISVNPVFENDVCARIVGTVQDITEVKEASEKILKEKKLSDSIIRNLPGIFFLFNKAGKFLRWNKNFEEFSVYNVAEINQKSPTDLVEDVDKPRIKEVIKKVFKEGNAEIEANILNRSGEMVPMYFSGWAATFEGEPCVIGMAIDISERKKAENKLKESEQKFNTLVNTVDGIVWEAEAETLKYTFVSKQAEELLGYPINEWTDNATFWVEHMHPDDKEKAIEYWGQIKTGHRARLLEYRMITATGKEIWFEDIVAVINVDGRAKYLRGIMTDISVRKQRDLELQASHSKYLAIIDNSMTAFVLTNDNQEILETNETTREMFGYTIEELNKLKLGEIFDYSYPKFAEGVEMRKKTGKGKGEVYGMKKNGEKFPLAFTSSMFVNAEGKEMISAIGIDISDRIQYEESLVKSNERFEKVSEATFDAIWDWDVKTHTLYLGRGFKELFGYEIDNVSSEFATWADNIHPEDKDEIVLSRLNKIIQYNEDKWSDEYRYIRADGSIAYVLDRGILLREKGLTYRMIGAMQDISTRKLAEAELLKSNERFLYVSKATFDAIWDWDILTDQFYWGDGFEQLFGYKLTDNKGNIEDWKDHIYPDDLDRVIKGIEDCINGNEINWKDDYRYLKADGTYAYVADKGIVVRDANGKGYRMIGAMRDITSRKRDEEKLNQLNKELENKAEQLSISNSELESFAYVTSHDLQEPLRMVSSFLQLLQKKYESQLDEKGMKYINFAIDGSERMKILIQDLLEFSRINSSREIHGQVDLNDIARKTISNLRRVIEEANASVTISILPLIYGNESQLMQLFQNLIGNAIKYRSERDPVIAVGYKERDEEWEFFVKDNGIGIDEKFYHKIFVIFQRLHNRKEYDGTGIGLAVCKKIVDFHGGKIWLESITGEGTTFYFTISKNLL